MNLISFYYYTHYLIDFSSNLCNDAKFVHRHVWILIKRPRFNSSVEDLNFEIINSGVMLVKMAVK